MGKAENKIEEYFRKQVKGEGFIVRKLRWVAHRGAPDRIVIGYGQVHFVELKAPGKPLEDHQAREHKKLKAEGASVWVIDSRDGVEKFIQHALAILRKEIDKHKRT